MMGGGVTPRGLITAIGPTLFYSKKKGKAFVFFSSGGKLLFFKQTLVFGPWKLTPQFPGAPPPPKKTPARNFFLGGISFF